jgi:hypothetical protein
MTEPRGRRARRALADLLAPSAAGLRAEPLIQIDLALASAVRLCSGHLPAQAEEEVEA